MRVLHLDSGAEMRGGQWQVLYLLTELGRGHTLLCPEQSPLMRAARERGIDAKALTMVSLYQTSASANLIHAHDARSHSWAAALGAKPLLVARRVAFPVGQSLVSRWKYSRPSHYIAVSEYVKITLLHAKVPPEKVSVVYDGVPMPPETGSGTRVVAPATADPMKGSSLLARAASMAGITVHYSTNLADDLKDAALFVYITQAEGLGSAALLAMAAGVPVVASRIGGLPEIIREGETGLLTDNEPSAIAQAIRSAMDQRSLLSPNTRRFVESRFTTRAMAAATRQVYEKVLHD